MSMRSRLLQKVAFAVLATVVGLRVAAGAEAVQDIDLAWDQPTTVVKTGLSLEVCVEPPMRRGKVTHDPLFNTLRDLGGDYSRLAFWFPYPRMAVAELEPPENGKTSWNFDLLDPIVIDFLHATQGHPVLLNVSTIPQWMFVTKEKVSSPRDPDEIDFKYDETGTELRDPSLKEIRDYFVRVVSWYTQGGFTDEYGKRHESGHHFKIDAWEVLNEIDLEHHLSPQLYTRIYDEVVGELKKLDPQMKFSGPAYAQPRHGAEFLEYFLDPRHHRAGIPIDFVSYHFYAGPEHDETPEIQEHTFFALTDGFISNVRYIEALRKRLAPHTKTYIEEFGTFSNDNTAPDETVPDLYWSLSAATFAHGYLALSKQQIDLLAGTELINYPGQYPGASLSNWVTGAPNARYHVVKLLHDHIHLGDRIVDMSEEAPHNNTFRYFDAAGYVAQDGSRKVLIINKRNRVLRVKVPHAAGSQMTYMDVDTGAQPPKVRVLKDDVFDLAGYAVAVLQLPR